MSSIACSTVAKGVCFSSLVAIRWIVPPDCPSVGAETHQGRALDRGLSLQRDRPSQRLEDELRDLELDRSVARLARQDRHSVVQMCVARVAGRVECGAYDFASVVSCAAVAAVVERDPRPVLGLDHALEIGQIDVVEAKPRVIQAAKTAGQSALAATFGQEDAADVRAVDLVVLRIGELDTVKRGEPHRRASRSTYLARTSTSRLTPSPGSSEPSVVASSVCRTRATSKASSARAVIVSETPSTVIEPFSTA